MHISYKPLWHTLIERNMRKEDLRLAAGLTTNMIANMGKEGKHISMDTLARICETLDCGILEVIALEQDGEDIGRDGKNQSLRENSAKDNKGIFLENISKIHTTKMGMDRIKRNLKLGTADVVGYCKDKILDKRCHIYRQGKNWYCETGNIRITVNSYSYTIITAHIME